MPFTDPDLDGAEPAHGVSAETLALLALGEPAATPSEQAHLLGCPECRAEIDALARAANVGRASLGVEPLETPPARVWQRISSELEPEAEPERPLRASPTIAGLPTPRSRRRARRRVAIGIVSVAAATSVVAAGVFLWRWAAPTTPTSDVFATATLAGLPAWPNAAGEAVVHDLPDGGRIVRVTLDAPAHSSDYREAWLLTDDATSLVSLGIVVGTEATFAIPDDLDLSIYDVVDVSAEAYDGDPVHSGDSIVRGRLNQG